MTRTVVKSRRRQRLIAWQGEFERPKQPDVGFLKRWRYVLMALILFGACDYAVALVQTPGYRATRAYARIHEGMTRSEAKDVMEQFGGRLYSGNGRGYPDTWFFGDRELYALTLNLQSSADDETLCVAAKRLQRLQSRSFGDWFASLLERSTTTRRKQ